MNLLYNHGEEDLIISAFVLYDYTVREHRVRRSFLLMH